MVLRLFIEPKLIKDSYVFRTDRALKLSVSIMTVLYCRYFILFKDEIT